MPPPSHLPKARKNKKNRNKNRHHLLDEGEEKNPTVKTPHGTGELLDEEIDLDIEKARVFMVKIFETEALHDIWKKEDVNSIVEGEELV